MARAEGQRSLRSTLSPRITIHPSSGDTSGARDSTVASRVDIMLSINASVFLPSNGGSPVNARYIITLIAQRSAAGSTGSPSMISGLM